MTTITAATCTSHFPGIPDARCDRLPHADRMHVACVNRVPFAWSDPDDGALDDWERATLAAVRDVCGPPTGQPDPVTAVLAAVDVLVDHWRSLPGGVKGTERFDWRVKALIAAHDQLGNPAVTA